MRTPVLLVAGQGDTDSVTGTLLRKPGTLVVEHRFDGHVVKRTVSTLQDGINRQDGVLVTAETALELAHGCIACTIRDDLLILLRKLHQPLLAGGHHCTAMAVSHWWSSTPSGRFIPSACMPRSTCCSTAWSASAAGCGFRVGRSRPCGSSRQEAGFGPARRESGWPP
ncbi:MAG: hypothetical protein JWR34_4558 [Mycobacterium sp.]|nr:hypothetical protein [Mycobacterium sp.]